MKEQNQKARDGFIDKIKAINPNIKILDEYISLKNHITCQCKTCGNIWSTSPNTLYRGSGCPECAKHFVGDKFRISQEDFVNMVKKLNKGFTVIGKYVNNNTSVNIKCQNNHIWSANPRNLLHNNAGCPYCAGKAVWIGENDLWTTHPDVAKLLTNPEDGYKYSYGSGKKVSWTCPECGDISEKTISQITYAGFSCQKCSDGISFPNKFGRAFLDQLPIDNFVCEYTPVWAKPYIYDNYFEYNDQKYILEMDGAFHYKDNITLSQSLDVRQNIDRIKTDLAIKHDISVVRIDCRKSDGDYIKSNILSSELNTIFDLSHINWILCEQRARKNLVKEASDLYASGITDLNIIMKHLHIGISSTLEYVKIGTKLGWCDYSYEASKLNRIKKCQRSIVIVDDCNNVLHYFNGIRSYLNDIGKIYNTTFNGPNIIKSCQTHKPYKDINFHYADEYVPKDVIDEIKLKDNSEELFFNYLTQQNDSLRKEEYD